MAEVGFLLTVFGGFLVFPLFISLFGVMRRFLF